MSTSTSIFPEPGEHFSGSENKSLYGSHAIHLGFNTEFESYATRITFFIEDAERLSVAEILEGIAAALRKAIADEATDGEEVTADGRN